MEKLDDFFLFNLKWFQIKDCNLIFMFYTDRSKKFMLFFYNVTKFKYIF